MIAETIVNKSSFFILNAGLVSYDWDFNAGIVYWTKSYEKRRRKKKTDEKKTEQRYKKKTEKEDGRKEDGKEI